MTPSFYRNILVSLGKLDKLSLCFHAILLAIGVIFIYGAGVEIGGELARKWSQQLVWICAGSLVYCTCAVIDYHKLGHFSWIAYVFSLLLLILVVVAGTKINNASSWLSLMGITVQPSEFAKPATLLFVCWAVTHRNWHKSPVPPWLIVLVIIFPPLFLVLLQPDFGTALVFIPFSLAISYLKGLSWKWILLGAVATLLMIPVIYQFLSPHQKSRIKVFLEAPSHALMPLAAPILPEERLEKLREAQKAFFAEDEYQTAHSQQNGTGAPKKQRRPRDNWNAQQSLLAVGSGGVTGKGFLKGTQHILGYLPKNVAPSDFIFSVIAEETGFFGSALLLVCFASLLLCGFRTALLARDSFGVCLATGVSVIFATHIFINIGMTIQAAPIIGIPLPFVSYGGSFMIAVMGLAGLSQSVFIHRTSENQDDNELS